MAARGSVVLLVLVGEETIVLGFASVSGGTSSGSRTSTSVSGIMTDVGMGILTVVRGTVVTLDSRGTSEVVILVVVVASETSTSSVVVRRTSETRASEASSDSVVMITSETRAGSVVVRTSKTSTSGVVVVVASGSMGSTSSSGSSTSSTDTSTYIVVVIVMAVMARESLLSSVVSGMFSSVDRRDTSTSSAVGGRGVVRTGLIDLVTSNGGTREVQVIRVAFSSGALGGRDSSMSVGFVQTSGSDTVVLVQFTNGRLDAAIETRLVQCGVVVGGVVESRHCYCY